MQYFLAVTFVDILFECYLAEALQQAWMLHDFFTTKAVAVFSSTDVREYFVANGTFLIHRHLFVRLSDVSAYQRVYSHMYGRSVANNVRAD